MEYPEADKKQADEKHKDKDGGTDAEIRSVITEAGF